MCPIPNTSRSNSDSKTPGETGSVAAAFAGKDYYQELISKANTVPLVKIFKHYNIRLDMHNVKTTCPFKSHAGGRERTASLKFYVDTNTFYCFGCKAGVRACDFVVGMERCTKVQAAQKILQLFGSDVNEDDIYDPEDSEARLTIMMDFSNTVREFRQTYLTERAEVYVDRACKKLDTLSLKKKLNNEALSRIVGQLKEYINLYKP